MKEADKLALLETGFPLLTSILKRCPVSQRLELERVHSTWRLCALITYENVKTFRLDEFRFRDGTTQIGFDNISFPSYVHTVDIEK